MDFIDVRFYLYFLPVFFVAYAAMPHKAKNWVLLAGSALFYAWGEPRFLAVLPASIVFNFLFGRLLEAHPKKGILWVGILANFSMLFYYKLMGDGIPLGLSFYSFQAVAYLADVWKREISSERRLDRFALFLGMFPKLGSGPITPYGSLGAELRERRVSLQGFQEGLQLLVLGLSAKVLLADRLEILWHDVGVAGYESISWRHAWLGAIGYSLKLYFDFYGYSLMAVGLGRMMGFDLPNNFNVPYLARSVRDFYRRWHVTLGEWFRKYVYIPLGGSRRGEGRTVVNLLAVWLLTGSWHGTGLHFLLWGIFLWCCIVLERQAEKVAIARKLRILPRLYLWFVIPISWMLFAIPDLSQLQTYLCRMFGLGEAVNGNPLDWLLALQRHGGALLIAAACASGAVEQAHRKWKDAIWLNLILAGLFWLCIWKLMRQGSNPFLYVNF